MAKKDEKAATLANAEKFAAALKKDPTLTVDDLAAQFDLSHEDAVAILDEHVVEDGAVSHAGPGQGGGWVATEES